jgi:probable F420-dependent oxidoreductase
LTVVAGEVADGMLVHAFSTERYMREVTLPALQRGLDASGRTRADVQLSMPVFIVTGTTEEEMAAASEGTRDQIAFYGSTPAYKGVLDLHGWGDLAVELNRLSRSGRPEAWREMGDLVEQDVLDAFAIVAEPDQVAAKIVARYDGLLDRFSFYAPYKHDTALFDGIVRELAAKR